MVMLEYTVGSTHILKHDQLERVTCHRINRVQYMKIERGEGKGRKKKEKKKRKKRKERRGEEGKRGGKVERKDWSSIR